MVVKERIACLLEFGPCHFSFFIPTFLDTLTSTVMPTGWVVLFVLLVRIRSGA